MARAATAGLDQVRALVPLGAAQEGSPSWAEWLAGGDAVALLHVHAGDDADAARFGDYVVIRAGTDKEWLRIEVDDDGPGIPPEEHEKVFRRLYRLDKSRSTPGSGRVSSKPLACAASSSPPNITTVFACGLRRRPNTRSSNRNGATGRAMC